jgi:hypothetical protein
MTSIIVEAGCTITPGGGELGDFSGPEELGLHLQRLIERLNRVGAGEDAGVHSLSGCPGRRKPEGGGSQLVPGYWSDLAAGVLVVHLMRNNNNDLKSNKRLKS